MVLDSRWIGKGARVAEFEAAWAAHVGVPVENMVSTNSCTSALFEAVRLAGIGAGDEVIIPTIHFIGAAQAVIAAGGTPVFCDVNRWTMNATDEAIDEKYHKKKTKAVIMNHYGGNMCKVDRRALPSWIVWIDDLACAPMAKVSDLDNLPNGEIHKFDSDFAVWSFDGMKVLTCGDGGMLYCRHSDAAAFARSDFCLGVNSESGLSSTSDNRWWEFQVQSPGAGRHLMNDLAASMGIEQLRKIDGFMNRRREIRNWYNDVLSREFELPDVLRREHKSPYFYWIFTKKRDELARHLRANDVYTSFRYFPLHRAYNTGDSLPNAEWAAEHALLLPLHNGLTDADVEYVCEKVKEFYGR